MLTQGPSGLQRSGCGASNIGEPTFKWKLATEEYGADVVENSTSSPKLFFSSFWADS